jgi:hypothetical protein
MDYKDQGLMVLAIGLGQNQTQCQNWINNHGITHPVLSDMGYTVWNQFGMGYIPHNAVMDCADVVTFTNYGFNESVIRNRIETALPDMIQFDHDPLQSAPEQTPIEISSGISADSEFSEGFPQLYYRANGALWLAIEMTDTGNDIFVAEIPGQPPGSIVDYYFRAEQVAGCPRTYPMPNQFFTLTVEGDPEPTATPTITPTPTNTATPTNTPIPTSTPTQGDCVNHGDANQDGILTAADAQLTFQIVLGTYTPTYQQECAADCNGDGVITAADAQNVFMAVLGTATCVDPL